MARVIFLLINKHYYHVIHGTTEASVRYRKQRMGEAKLVPLQTASQSYESLIGGKSVAAQGGRTIDVICPSDGSIFAKTPRSGQADVDMAVQAHVLPSTLSGVGSPPPSAAG
ncbi:hypothetical protein [Roseovarius azorensis]|uniref:hypothetical protein n=1 Tax=Roseovarius azorensis TaxID=1287727 RepID=UPI001FE4C337|nr:hypothetical protein [Roseovarius azorensis]